MEDALLDMSQDELVIKETQHGDSPATFSRNLVDHFGIIAHNIQTSSETINPTDIMPHLFSLAPSETCLYFNFYLPVINTQFFIQDNCK